MSQITTKITINFVELTLDGTGPFNDRKRIDLTFSSHISYLYLNKVCTEIEAKNAFVGSLIIEIETRSEAQTYSHSSSRMCWIIGSCGLPSLKDCFQNRDPFHRVSTIQVIREIMVETWLKSIKDPTREDQVNKTLLRGWFEYDQN